MSQIQSTLEQMLGEFSVRETPLEAFLKNHVEAAAFRRRVNDVETEGVLEEMQSIDLDAGRSDEGDFEDISSFGEMDELATELTDDFVDSDESDESTTTDEGRREADKIDLSALNDIEGDGADSLEIGEPPAAAGEDDLSDTDSLDTASGEAEATDSIEVSDITADLTADLAQANGDEDRDLSLDDNVPAASQIDVGDNPLELVENDDESVSGSNESAIDSTMDDLDAAISEIAEQDEFESTLAVVSTDSSTQQLQGGETDGDMPEDMDEEELAQKTLETGQDEDLSQALDDLEAAGNLEGLSSEEDSLLSEFKSDSLAEDGLLDDLDLSVENSANNPVENEQRVSNVQIVPAPERSSGDTASKLGAKFITAVNRAVFSAGRTKDFNSFAAVVQKCLAEVSVEGATYHVSADKLTARQSWNGEGGSSDIDAKFQDEALLASLTKQMDGPSIEQVHFTPFEGGNWWVCHYRNPKTEIGVLILVSLSDADLSAKISQFLPRLLRAGENSLLP